METNPYFKKTKENAFYDEEAFGYARSQFVDIKKTFLDRLACAQVFDRERFEAMILWLEELKEFHEKNYEPMEEYYLDGFHSIQNHLEIQSKYSTDQKEECTEALSVWSKIIDEYTTTT
ncbi:hypothetical protein [Coraliomargarita akajimensis]|uniref:Uncharacterized protein n=1 Tax=Coraliomargarita akajimensis (strain DSM 45221 / IAM 15411 / JCM 23193 / KCTC 12865 / 04OKA010-24) TaxID=583355 RepID=D5EMC8_CORAD|nr:hypothetical protein [Coraliomargarita akajimensis]ADE53334.1 hypothetical protein Caka_0309 [Coraliomargarita akajimensis DSM 45221]